MSLAGQEEREHSVKAYRESHKDVLVATDVASKGLDFPNVQHVINYDMPEDIENYGKSYKYGEICPMFGEWARLYGPNIVQHCCSNHREE